MRFRLTSAAAAALVICVLSLGAVSGAMAGAGGNGNGSDNGNGGGSNSTATAGPGNSGQGCDGTHHSDTGHGANQGGPYDNTCDGSPSGNGNGNGNATGKPCAGCVGNADDKNPKGQMPNGSDHNAGYECDRNHGIGRTNPAHTGCRETTVNPPPPECTTPGGCKPPECTTPGGCKPGGGSETPPKQTETPPQQAVLGTRSTGSTPAVTVAPESTTPAPAPKSAVLGVSQRGNTPASASTPAPPASVTQARALPASTHGSLPFSGSDVLAVLLAGVLTLLAGLALQRAMARSS